MLIASYFDHWSTANTLSVLFVFLCAPLLFWQLRLARKCNAIRRLPEHLPVNGGGFCWISTNCLPTRLNADWQKLVLVQGFLHVQLGCYTLLGGYYYLSYVIDSISKCKSFKTLAILSPLIDLLGIHALWIVALLFLLIAGNFFWWSINMFRAWMTQRSSAKLS